MAFSIIRNIIDKIAHTRRSSAITGPFGLLPQELLDLIIAHLGDDKVTLLSCALVHSTWTIISRYHLPSVMLVVSSPSRSKELVKLLRASPETLSSSITGITLVGDIPVDDIDMDGKSPRAQSYLKLFQVLKAKHVALRSGMAENDPSLVWLFAQHFPDLSELQVTCASYQDIRSFMRALAGSFLRPSELSIELGSSGMDLPDASLSGLRNLELAMPCLRSLRLVGWNNELVRWLGDNVAGTLERLEMKNASVWSTCHVEEAFPLIQGNKETLKDLRLSFMRRNVVFDLSGLTHLKYLEVGNGMGDALHGWLLPLSLKTIELKDVVSVLHGYGMGAGEGDDFNRALEMY